MTTIKNITKKPISVPLPLKKRLFLGPGKSSQINPKAVDHAPLAALIEAGDLEITDDSGNFSSRDGLSGPNTQSGQRHSSGGKFFRAGDG